MTAFPEPRLSGTSLVHLLLASCTLVVQPAFAQDPAPPETARVVSVYDGDTMTLDTGDRVRLRWVNTPELRPYEPFAAEARDATEAFVGGKVVTLIYGDTVRDHYGRLVAGVEVEGEDLSEYLVEKGLAHVFIIPPDEHDNSTLLSAQAEARAAGRGLWSTTRYKGDLHITSFHANGRGDDRENVNGEYLRVANVSAGPVNLSGWTITDLTDHRWTLPAIEVPAGYTFEIRSGKGDNQANVDQQIVVYLQSDYPIWNNDRDRATLANPAGEVSDARDHQVKSRQN